MKSVKSIQKISLVLVFSLFAVISISAQAKKVILKQRERIAQAETNPEKPDEEIKTDKTVTPKEKIVENTSTKSDHSDVADISNYYVNYLTEYRLGPEDVISVQVFGQCPDYCKDEITVPPTAIISYPLIREGIFVGGKTIDQLTDEITKNLDEYIIDPKVTVSLVKVGSARYGVIGKVEKQGNFVMTRKISIFDAISESGGVSKEGDKKRAIILRPTINNKLEPILVDLKAIQEGQAEMAYLKPGDQVFIPKEGFNINTALEIASKFSLLRILLPF